MRPLDELLAVADKFANPGKDESDDEQFPDFTAMELVEELAHHVKGYRARRNQDRTAIFEQQDRIRDLQHHNDRLTAALSEKHNPSDNTTPARLAAELRRRADLLRSDSEEAARIALPWLLDEAATLIDNAPSDTLDSPHDSI